MAQPSDILTDYISPGDVFGGRYEIDRQLDAGSYGVIYLASDRDTGEKVAVKALPPRGEGSSEKAIGRFERELKVVRNLDHERIVRVVDYGETDEDVLYMVMEYVEGFTLDEAVGADESFGIDRSLSVTRQIADALRSAHEAGVIHRDLKPANIMLIDSSGEYKVKILDFGMAKLFAELGGESIVALTRDGVAVGTPRYVAPEQARGTEEIGPWSDLYAVGLLLYEMLFGRKAVSYDEVDAAVAAHVDSKPLHLPGLDELPNSVRALVRDLTRKEPDERLGDAAEAERRIESIERERATGEHDSYDKGDRGWSGEVAQGDYGSAMSDGTRPIYGSVGSTPDVPDTPEPSELGERAGGEERSIAVDRDDFAARGSRGRKSADTSFPAFVERLSPTSRLALGILVTVCGTFLAFVALTAQFHDFRGFRRAMFGLTPIILAAVSVLVSGRPKPYLQFFRNAAGFNLIGFVVAHVLGPGRLVHGLAEEPAWFLDSLRSEPVLAWIPAAVTWLGHGYSFLLDGILNAAG